MVPSLPLLSCESSLSVKENPDRKKKHTRIHTQATLKMGEGRFFSKYFVQDCRTNLRKSLKGILNCCKLKIAFKSQNKLAKAFSLKDRSPKELISGVVYKFQCGVCNESYYGECVRHLNVS